MRFTRRKLFLLSLVPFMGALIIPTIALSACGKSAQFTPAPTQSIKKFSLADVGFGDWNVHETDANQAKADISQHVHDLVNQKNWSLNGKKYELKEGVDYQITGDEEVSLKKFIDLTTPKLEINVKAVDGDQYLNAGDVTFRAINSKDMSQYCDLGSITLDSISLGTNDCSKLRTEIVNEITRQLNQQFAKKLQTLHQTIKDQDWVICDFENWLQKLVGGYCDGITLDITVRSAEQDPLLINTTRVKISNSRGKMIYITNLPKNYTIQEYADGINQSSASIATMNQNEVLSQIQIVVGQLEQITTEIMNIDQQLSWVNQEWPMWTEEDFMRAYQILSRNINPNFYWPADYFKEKAQGLLTKPEFQAIYPSLLAYHLAESSLPVIRSEFPVHELFILVNRFMQLNQTDPRSWTQDLKNAIGNTVLELNCWIDLQQFLGTVRMSDPQDWDFFYGNIKLKNLDFLQEDMKNFRKTFAYIIMRSTTEKSTAKNGPHIAPPPKDLTRVLVNYEFIRNVTWRNKSCTDVYLPNQNIGQVLYLPFATLTGTVTIDHLK